jgi:UDP-glucose 4-epimerase
MAQSVVVTGANGFVGKVVSRQLLKRGEAVVGVVRRGSGQSEAGSEWVLEGSDFERIEHEWPTGLQCDAVVHLAARVHMMHDTSADPLAAYRSMNVNGTMRVARAARRAGARRFVFVSSIKASGERSGDHPISESDAPQPSDPYGISKLEAERALFEYGQQSGLEVAVVRPPLVYGPGVRANFLRLMQALAKGVPLPLGAIGARRSIVFVDNLADAIVRCVFDAQAAGQTFHVADEHDLSVSELASTLAQFLQAPRRLLPVPSAWLRLAGQLTGRSTEVDRLIGELRIDTSHIRSTLGWRPPFTAEQGLKETAAWYCSTH